MCGGQSTRMGSDKGLMKQGNLTWTEVAVAKLRSLGIPVVVSVNRKQVDTYSKTFSLNELIVDDENILVGGPLHGLMSVHCQFPGEDLCVIACDMVNLEETALQNLVAAHNQNDFDAYVFTTIERVQPLCGIYTSGGLKRIHVLNLQQQLKKNSMMYVLECLNTKYISADALIESFTNFNSLEDISIRRMSCSFRYFKNVNDIRE